jgi:hypothetical protein
MTVTSVMATITAKIPNTTECISARIRCCRPFLTLCRIGRNHNDRDSTKERNDPSQYRLRGFLRASQSDGPMRLPGGNDVQKHGRSDNRQKNRYRHDILQVANAVSLDSSALN